MFRLWLGVTPTLEKHLLRGADNMEILEDVKHPIEERVEDLLSRMTIEQK